MQEGIGCALRACIDFGITLPSRTSRRKTVCFLVHFVYMYMRALTLNSLKVTDECMAQSEQLAFRNAQANLWLHALREQLCARFPEVERVTSTDGLACFADQPFVIAPKQHQREVYHELFGSLVAQDLNLLVPVDFVASDQQTSDYNATNRRCIPTSEYQQLLKQRDTTAYLKDFHFVLHRRRSQAASLDSDPAALIDYGYAVPWPFVDDALNAWFDARQDKEDDYRFLYCGPPASSTPIHHDVLGSCSWSVNLTGWKLWVFAQPDWARAHLYNALGRDLLVHDLLRPEDWSIVLQTIRASRDQTGETSDHLQATPIYGNKYNEAQSECRQAWEEACMCSQQHKTLDSSSSHDHGTAPFVCPRCTPGMPSEPPPLYFCLSGPGQAVYVPPLWHHQVINLGCEPSLQSKCAEGESESNVVLSVNHNWAGGAHLPIMWAFLEKEVEAVQLSIADCAQDARRIGSDPFKSPPSAVPSPCPLECSAAWADWYGVVDTVTAANCALGLADFGSLLLYRARTMCSWLRTESMHMAEGAPDERGVHPDLACSAAGVGMLERQAVVASMQGLLQTLQSFVQHSYVRARAYMVSHRPCSETAHEHVTRGDRTEMEDPVHIMTPVRAQRYGTRAPPLEDRETPGRWTMQQIHEAIEQVTACLAAL